MTRCAISKCVPRTPFHPSSPPPFSLQQFMWGVQADPPLLPPPPPPYFICSPTFCVTRGR